MRVHGVLGLAILCVLAAEHPAAALLESAGELVSSAERLIQKSDFVEAETLLLQAKELDPVSVEARYRLGYVFYRQRKLPEAVHEFTWVVENAPPAYYSRYFLGRIALLGNRFSDAIRWLEPVAASEEPLFDTESQLAKAYAALGRPKKTLQALSQAIARAPWDGGLYYRQARAYEQLGMRALAREAFATSRRLRKTDNETVTKLLRCSELVAGGHKADAVRLRDELVANALVDPDALVAAGVIFGAAGMQEEAIVPFRKAAEREPSLFQAQFNTGLALLKLGRAEEAGEPLKKAVALLPQSAEAHAALGLALVLRSQHGEAVPSLNRALELDRSNVRLMNLLALAHVRSGQAGKAVPLLRRAISLVPQDNKPRFLLIEALNQTHDEAGAVAVAQEAAQQAPDQPQPHLALAQQLARVGRYQDAGPHFEKVLKLAAGHPDALLGLGEVIEKRGDYEKALESYSQVPANTPGALEAKLGIGRTLVALRRVEEARTVLEQAVAEHPRDAQLRFDLSRVYARLGKREEAAVQARIHQQLKAEPPQNLPSP